MTAETERLRNLLADELGECSATDVSRRLTELDELLEESSVEDVSVEVEVLSTLANDTRYRIVRLLATADEELCVCEFKPLLDVSESGVSHALSSLSDAGLVERRQDGKWRYYRATPLAERLLDALDTDRETTDA